MAQTTTRPTRKRPLWHYIVAGFIIAIPIAIITMPPPKIPQAAIDEAVHFIMQDPAVRDATVLVDGEQAVLAIVVARTTSAEYGRQLGDSFARQLATLAALHSDVKGYKKPPTKDYLGGLWDYYTLQVVVAYDANTVLVEGFKAKSAGTIRWSST